MTIRARTLILAGGGLLAVSTAFPVVAGLMRTPASGWLGTADVVVAALLVCQAFLIAAWGSAKADPGVSDMSLRVLRSGANLFLVLVVVYFLAGHRVKWDILLPGLAWRAWLFVWVLPGALALWHRSEPSQPLQD